MNKQTFVEYGKKGAKKRWKGRYDILEALSAHVNKDEQNRLLKWSTRNLELLLRMAKHKLPYTFD